MTDGWSAGSIAICTAANTVGRREVNHYAKTVRYDANGFVERNKDDLSQASCILLFEKLRKGNSFA